jgi:hypothetical protein
LLKNPGVFKSTLRPIISPSSISKPHSRITILQPDAGLLTSALQSAAILSLIFSLQIGVSRYCFTPLKWNESFAFLATALFSLIAIFTRNEYFFFIGLILFAGSIFRQLMVRRKIRPLSGESAAGELL